MLLATWNINSVRLRIELITHFVKKYNIDVLCLQETKTEDNHFPCENFRKIGLKYKFFQGQKSYNGVAVLSKIPFKKKFHYNWCGLNDARHVAVTLENNITLHNFYVPAGGDIPDPKINYKFKQKIDFLKAMTSYFKEDKKKKKIILGDLNIAPNENDVWSHTKLLKVVSYTPLERKYLFNLMKEGRLIDVVRLHHKSDEKLYSWWSYRSKDWMKSNKGTRLDHIFTSRDLASKIVMAKICKELRAEPVPSDHVPIIVKIRS